MGAELILLFPIKSASTGPMGPAETAGAKDTAGPAGPAAATISMNAQNTAASPLAIIIGKIAIPLPNDQFQLLYNKCCQYHFYVSRNRHLLYNLSY